MTNPVVTVLDGRLTQLGDEGNDVVRIRVTDSKRQIADVLLASTNPVINQLNLRKRYLVRFEEIPDSPAGA